MKPINKTLLLLAIAISGSFAANAQQKLASDKPLSELLPKHLQEKIAKSRHRIVPANSSMAANLPSARPIPRPVLPAGVHFAPAPQRGYLSGQEKIKLLPSNNPVSIQEVINKRKSYRSLQEEQ